LLKGNENKNSKLYTKKSDVKNHISELRKQIEANKELIEKVIQARNKNYAHKDPNANVQLVKFEELKSLTNLASQIFNELQFRLFFNKTLLDELNDWSINYVIQNMSALRKIDDEERKRKIGLYKKE
jgi:predicted RNA-binding protein with EMAP domain